MVLAIPPVALVAMMLLLTVTLLFAMVLILTMVFLLAMVLFLSSRCCCCCGGGGGGGGSGGGGSSSSSSSSSSRAFGVGGRVGVGRGSRTWAVVDGRVVGRAFGAEAVRRVVELRAAVVRREYMRRLG